MRKMNEHNLARLEARLEDLIEGVFSQIFGGKLRAHDIALKLARAMEAHTRPSPNQERRIIAPDHYIVYVPPQTHKQLLEREPNLAQILAEYLLEFAADSDYHLNNKPFVQILADTKSDKHDLTIVAGHIDDRRTSTAAMQSVKLPSNETKPRNAQFVIDDARVYPLDRPLINIGRGHSNQLILDDPYVSRQHAQVRLRFGHYVLFDVESRVGIFVNDVRVKEHKLQSGDVIRIGRTRLVYTDDNIFDDSTGSITAIDLDPIR
ncbi:MAG: DUF2662 domain-containing protein [Chloroflexi bacterium]|nr:MAG: DUF2662 domain-containing protein [Chloroflexota bacterium]